MSRTPYGETMQYLGDLGDWGESIVIRNSEEIL
jgi:hypothetical protein